MTTPLFHLSAVRWPAFRNHLQACGNGLFYGLLNAAGPAEFGEWVTHMAANPKDLVVATRSQINTGLIGGKHRLAITSDEGWGWCVGMAARLCLDHDNVIAGLVSSYSNHGELFHISQHLWVEGRFPGVSLFTGNNIHTPPVAKTYDHAYGPPACTTDDDALLACVDGWAWSILFFEKVGNTADAKWCVARIVEAATSVWTMYLRTGGGVQFWDSRTGLVLPGREHEPPSLSIRSTISAGWVCLYAWAVTGGEEWLRNAKQIAYSAQMMQELCPDAVWVALNDDGDAYYPVGAGWKGSPSTIYTEREDDGPNLDAAQNAAIPRYPGLAVIPMPSSFNPRMGRTRDPDGQRNTLAALRATIGKVEATNV